MSFEAYWVQYLAAHSHPAIRRVHVLSTGAALVCAAAGILSRQRWLVLAAPGVGFVPAWLSHRVLGVHAEHPAASPIQALAANLLLFWKTLDGTIEEDLEKLRTREPDPVTVEPPIPAPNMVTDGTLH